MSHSAESPHQQERKTERAFRVARELGARAILIGVGAGATYVAVRSGYLDDTVPAFSPQNTDAARDYASLTIGAGAGAFAHSAGASLRKKVKNRK